MVGEAASLTAPIGVEVVAELLVIAPAAALAAERFRLPYTVALVVVDLAVGFTTASRSRGRRRAPRRRSC